MTSILQAMGYIQDQADAGQKKGLARLLGSAYGAAPEQRQQILGTVAQRGGLSESLAADKGFAEQEDNVHLQMAKRAREVVALYKANPQMAQQIYQNGLVPLAARAGVTNPPPQLDDTLIPGLEKLASAAVDKSSELQTFDEMTAGLPADDVLKSRRIHLGLDPRAVTGAMRFDTWTDSAGNPRPQRNNPTTGQIEVYVDEKGQWVPLGGGVGQSAPSATKVEIAGVPKDEQDRISRVATAMEQAGYSADDINAFVASRLPGGQVTQQSGLGVGRTKEAETYATESAKNQANIDSLPTIGGLEATNAGLKSAAEVAGKSGAEAQFNLPKVEQSANMMLTAIRELKNDPALKSIVGLNGKFNPSVYIPGTPEQRALTRIKQINGQAFLQAYQTLRGGGQITEVEGQKATEAMGRLDRAQSYADYKTALDELETVINNGLNTARKQAGGGGASGGRVLRYNPATGAFE